ncbi:MAG: hypothetical protein Q7T13_08090 [Polaromonas sp.]|nr:hypothetical protein [Polaromonas sp.]
MKFLFVIVFAFVVTGCTHMNVYEGGDAARVPVPCDFHPAIASDGKPYLAVSVQILEIDGKFTGSGQGCKEGYVYRIKPGPRQLKVIANYLSGDGEVIKFGLVMMAGNLEARNTYTLQSQFDGKTITATLVDSLSQKTIARGQTAEIRMQSGRRTLILPIMVR